MGMDVYGKNPTSEKGKYFRASVWSWHPIWEYCETLAPALTGKVENGHTNDGDGLNAADSVKLSKAIKKALKSGRVHKDVQALEALSAMIPDEPCKICGGTGKRLPPPVCGPGTMDCNGCGATGKVRPFTTHYTLHEDMVEEFADFLADCGGFEIC